MKRLSLDDISNAPSLPEKEIEIEQWNATVLVTGLTKADAVELINNLKKMVLEMKFFLRSYYFLKD